MLTKEEKQKALVAKLIEEFSDICNDMANPANRFPFAALGATLQTLYRFETGREFVDKEDVLATMRWAGNFVGGRTQILAGIIAATLTPGANNYV